MVVVVVVRPVVAGRAAAVACRSASSVRGSAVASSVGSAVASAVAPAVAARRSAPAVGSSVGSAVSAGWRSRPAPRSRPRWARACRWRGSVPRSPRRARSAWRRCRRSSRGRRRRGSRMAMAAAPADRRRLDGCRIERASAACDPWWRRVHPSRGSATPEGFSPGRSASGGLRPPDPRRARPRPGRRPRRPAPCRTARGRRPARSPRPRAGCGHAPPAGRRRRRPPRSPPRYRSSSSSGRSWTNRPASEPATGPGVSNRSGNTPTRKSRAARSSASVTGASRIRSSSTRNSWIDGHRDLGVHRRAGGERAPRPRRMSNPAEAP